MKFKKILIIFLCVALLVVFSVSCFATTQESYGFYISPGRYVFDNSIDFTFNGFTIDLRFSSFVGNDYHEFDSILVDSSVLYFFNGNPANNYGLSYSDGQWLDNLSRSINVFEGFFIYDINAFQWWQSNVTRVSSGYNSSFFDNILSIFTAIGQWISGAAANLTSMFFVDNSLTFVGTLCIAALAMSVAFLIIGLISLFLRFKA